MELTTEFCEERKTNLLFMMSKIQNLNGTHNHIFNYKFTVIVVYDVKDTKFEWNSQPKMR